MIRDIVIARKKKSGKFESNRKIIKCVMFPVDFDRNPKVDGRPGYTWVKEYGESSGTFQVYNPYVQNRVGLPVLVGYEPKEPYRRMIIGFDYESAASQSLELAPGDYALPMHHTQHEWLDGAPGVDALQIYMRALVPMRVQATGSFLNIVIAPGMYITNGIMVQYFGETIDLQPYLPGVGLARRLLVYMDTISRTIQFVLSPDVVIGHTPDFSTPPTNGIPLAWVLLNNGVSTLRDQYVTDARVFLSNYTAMTIDWASIYTAINDRLAWLEADFDIEMSMHVVEG